MSLTSYRAAPPRVRAIGFESDGLPSGARRGEGRGLEFQGWSCAVLGCFTVRCFFSVLGRPGGDLLSPVLRIRTIGAEGFHGLVRDGTGCLKPRHSNKVARARAAGWHSAESGRRGNKGVNR